MFSNERAMLEAMYLPSSSVTFEDTSPTAKPLWAATENLQSADRNPSYAHMSSKHHALTTPQSLYCTPNSKAREC